MCGRCREYRERRYTKRPADPTKRHAFEVDTLCASSDVAWAGF
jgi:hypothetical protein